MYEDDDDILEVTWRRKVDKSKSWRKKLMNLKILASLLLSGLERGRRDCAKRHRFLTGPITDAF